MFTVCKPILVSHIKLQRVENTDSSNDCSLQQSLLTQLCEEYNKLEQSQQSSQKKAIARLFERKCVREG